MSPSARDEPGEAEPLISEREKVAVPTEGDSEVSLHTILSLPILYGVWHIEGGSGVGPVLRKSRAIVLQ